jgi:hypothetical protein
MDDIFIFFDDNQDLLSEMNFKIHSLFLIIITKLKQIKKEKQQKKYLIEKLTFIIKNWIDDRDVRTFFLKKINLNFHSCSSLVIIKALIFELDRQVI